MADRIKAVFLAALETPTDQRLAYLDRACGADAELRRRVEALLRAHAAPNQLLDRPVWHPTPEQHGPPTPPDADPGPAANPTEHAGRVRLLGEIARGGMGAVLRGHDPELEREVAVKVILPQHRNNPNLLRRFVGEARLAGQLQHPGIMPVYDVGQMADGRPFFSMKLIQGRTLADLLDERPDPGHDRPRFLRYFEAVCQAVGYAHANGVLHRDLKPLNVMIGAFGEVQVMDWGLAKRLEANSEEEPEQTPSAPAPLRSTPNQPLSTRPGLVIGSPGYMAPEQGRGQPGDQRSDVFGLGAILCEILTGAPPFRGVGLHSLLQQTSAGDLRDATERLDGCGADPELVRLAKVCLAAEPAGRPSDGSAVAAQLAEYLAGVQERLRRAEVGQARAEARAEGERTRRRLAVGLAAAVLAVVALGGGTLLLVQRHQAEQGREQARRQQAAESALARAADLQQQGRWDEALAVLEQARQRLDERDGQVSRDVRQAVADLELVQRLEKVRLRAATWTGRSFGWARADREYESEFRTAGLGGPDEPAEAVAERVRASGVRTALVAALDTWAESTEDRRRRDWVRAVARSADQGSDWGRRLRASWADPAALAQLAHETPIDRLSPHLLRTLALALENSQEGVSLLRRAQLHYPGDFWLNYGLAQRLAKEGRHEEAAGFYQAALAARPGTTAALVNLGGELEAQKKLDEALTCYRRAIKLDPGFAYAHNNLGTALADKGKVDEAIASYRKALEHDPKLVEAHTNLGNALKGKGKVDEAIASYRKALEHDPRDATALTALGGMLCDVKGDYDGAISCFRKALELDPKDAYAHFNLGNALKGKGQLDEAIAWFRKALELDAKLVEAHTNLGNALKGKGKVDEAIASYRKALEHDPRDATALTALGGMLCDVKGDYDGAITCFRKALELDPKSASVHSCLGNALKGKGKVDEAIASYRKALELDPKSAPAHYNLGVMLRGKGQLDEAIASYRKALELDPGAAEAHCNLGHALMARGDFAEALGPFQRGHELGSKRSDWKYRSDVWVRDCELLIEREKQLLDVLSGSSRPANARERLEWARLCVQTRRYVAAVRLSREAFETEGKLADDLEAGHRYRAAAAAALAGVGQGRDAGPLTNEARAALRRQALDWLKADLAAWRGHSEGSRRARALRNWRADKALVGVRDEEELAKLPRAESTAWRELWAEVKKP